VPYGGALVGVADRHRHLDQMALAVKAPAYTDAEMCGFARNATVTQLSMVVRRYGFESDPTDTWNLICLCPTHHRNQLGITGNADLAPGSRGAVVFTGACGRCIEPGAAPTTPGGPPPAPTGHHEHPLR